MSLLGKVAIVTGAAGGIGAQTARLLVDKGVSVVVADLPHLERRAQNLAANYGRPNLDTHMIFKPANILDWNDMTRLFCETKRDFGRLDYVVANAGVMETKDVLSLDDVDECGNLREPTEGHMVFDVNLKGTLNTLKLALFHMKRSAHPVTEGSIVLVTSTSGYFGSTGVTSYVASKHGVVGLLRASQRTGDELGIRINAVAPFFTPTQITSGYAAKWRNAGLETNTPSEVASAIVNKLIDSSQRGSCSLVIGGRTHEIEHARSDQLVTWLGASVANSLQQAMAFFRSIGGYPLPQADVKSEKLGSSSDRKASSGESDLQINQMPRASSDIGAEAVPDPSQPLISRLRD